MYFVALDAYTLCYRELSDTSQNERVSVYIEVD